MTDPNLREKTPSILITGSSGFLGRAIVRQLLSDETPLKPASLKLFDLLEETNPGSNGVTTIRGDVRDYESVEDACRSIDIVIHSAAIVDWGTHPEEEIYRTNFKGTENIIRACKAAGVKFLIFTSSLDAVYGGKPLKDVDESLPYPESHPNMYCKSKELAEQLVLGANNHRESEDGSRLQTMVLRPSDIYGEDDPFHIGSLLNMARSGFYVRLGDGSSKCQHTYVENVAYAHILAAASLWQGNLKPAGNIYFITDALGSNFFKFYERIIREAGYRVWPGNLWLHYRLAYAIGSLSEMIARFLSPVKKYNPKFSRFAVIYTCSDYTFTSEKAYRDFGFVPKFSEEEALQRTIEYYRKKNKKKQP